MGLVNCHSTSHTGDNRSELRIRDGGDCLITPRLADDCGLDRLVCERRNCVITEEEEGRIYKVNLHVDNTRQTRYFLACATFGTICRVSDNLQDTPLSRAGELGRTGPKVLSLLCKRPCKILREVDSR